MSVWFGHDCVCSNIEHLSNIDEIPKKANWQFGKIIVLVHFITQKLKFFKIEKCAFVSVSLVRGKSERIDSIPFAESSGHSRRTGG